MKKLGILFEDDIFLLKKTLKIPKLKEEKKFYWELIEWKNTVQKKLLLILEMPSVIFQTIKNIHLESIISFSLIQCMENGDQKYFEDLRI